MEDLTMLEVALRMCVTPLTVRLWLNAGSLRGLHCDDRATCRIREHDLANFLAARRRCRVQDRSPTPSPGIVNTADSAAPPHRSSGGPRRDDGEEMTG
jgi:hypothetical protein